MPLDLMDLSRAAAEFKGAAMQTKLFPPSVAANGEAITPQSDEAEFQQSVKKKMKRVHADAAAASEAKEFLQGLWRQQHQRRRSECELCGGGGGGGGTSEHQQMRSRCRECGGGSKSVVKRREQLNFAAEAVPIEDVGVAKAVPAYTAIANAVPAYSCWVEPNEEDSVYYTLVAEAVPVEVVGAAKAVPAHTVIANAVPASSCWVEPNTGGINHYGGHRTRDAEDRLTSKYERPEGTGRRNTGSTRSDSATQNGWREYKSASGRLYYNHKASQTTQWETPPGWRS